jgi:hypothetical protein
MTITEDQKLQAFALYVIAIDRLNDANRFHQAAAKVLGVDEDGHLSDAIFGLKVNDPSFAAFEEVLKREGVTVAPAEAA